MGLHYRDQNLESLGQCRGLLIAERFAFEFTTDRLNRRMLRVSRASST